MLVQGGLKCLAAGANPVELVEGLEQAVTETIAALKRSAKSLDGAVQVQADYAKTAFEGLVAQASRMGSLMVAVGTEAAKPFEGVSPFGTAPAGRKAAGTPR